MIDLPPDILARARGRRPDLAVHHVLQPVRTALLVVDMQNAWCAPGGPFETPTARAIVPAINSLARACRAAGAPVIWIQHTNEAPGQPGYWAGFFDPFLQPELRNRAARALVDGDGMHALYGELAPLPGDLFWRKPRFSLFINNPHRPHDELQRRGIDTLIVTGTATNICCESTARDAMMLDYRVFMPMDAVAAFNQDAHYAALATLGSNFADIRPAAVVQDLLAAAATPRAAE